MGMMEWMVGLLGMWMMYFGRSMFSGGFSFMH